MRRKGIFFTYKKPWGLDHSCLGDTEKMTKVDKEADPSDFLDEDYSLVWSMNSYEDTSEEHEQLYGVVDSSLNTYSYEQLIDPMGDIQGDSSLVIV